MDDNELAVEELLKLDSRYLKNSLKQIKVKNIKSAEIMLVKSRFYESI